MKKTRYHKIKKRNWSWYLVRGLVVVILLSLISLIARGIITTFQRKYAIEKEKQELNQQISRIKQDMFSLEQVKEYIQSSSYQEREAKQRLDLRKPGEEVVVITPGSIVANLDNQELVSILKNPEVEKRIPAQTNHEKWWAYFFEKNRLQ